MSDDTPKRIKRELDFARRQLEELAEKVDRLQTRFDKLAAVSDDEE